MIVRPRVLSGDYVWGLGSFSSSAGNFNEVGDRAAGKKWLCCCLLRATPSCLASSAWKLGEGGGQKHRPPTDSFSHSAYACMCVCVFEPSREPAPPKGSVLSANTGCVGREKISGPCFGCRLCDFHARLALSLYLACRRPIHSNSSHFCLLGRTWQGSRMYIIIF